MTTIEALFELSEVEESDTDALLRVRVAAFADDPLWRHLNVKSSYDDQLMFFKQFMKMGVLAEDKVSFKLTEKATGKIVAWASLKYPHSLRPSGAEMENPVSAKQVSSEPEYPKGFNVEVWIEITKGFTFPEPGYDPNIHFHRAGTMVLPEYQGKGLGKWLTRHCNEIADQHNCITHVRAKPAAAKMLQNSGFEVLGLFDPHLERFGWSKDEAEDQKTTILRRKPREDRDTVQTGVLL